MLRHADGARTDLNLEKVERLVASINAKCAALQRQVLQGSHSQGTLFNGFTADSTLSEMKLSVPSVSQSENGRGSAPADQLHPFPVVYKPHWPTYWNERELFLAASDLCQYLNGGVNYRAICIQYQSIIDIILAMLKEDIWLVRGVEFLPNGTLEKSYKVLSELIHESKELLVQHGVISGSPVPAVENAGNKSQSEVGEVPNPDYALPTALACSDSYNNNSTHQNRSSDRHNSGRGHGSRHETRVTISVPTEDLPREKPYTPLHLCCPSSKLLTDDSYDVNTPKLQAMDEVTLPGGQGTRHWSDGALKASMDPVNRSRYHAMEELYKELYLNEGMDMLVAMARMVFLHEYHNVDAKSREEAFTTFREHLDERLLPSIQTYEALVSPPAMRSSVRSEYVVNCLQQRVRPNKRLLDIFCRVESESDLQSIALANMRLHDTDIKPLASVLPRLYSLRSLDLSHNDIHDGGVRELCAALELHPSLEVLDLSDNPLTDTGGTALLQLATITTRLKAMGQQGVTFSPHIREALSQQLQKNRSAGDTAVAPRLLSNGGGVSGFGVSCRPSLTRRLAPLASLDGPRGVPAMNPTSLSTTPSPGMDSLVSRSMGMLRRVRLPYLTAMQNGQAKGGQRESDSSPR